MLVGAERAEALLRAHPDVLNVQRELAGAEAAAPNSTSPEDEPPKPEPAEEPASAPDASSLESPGPELFVADFTGDERGMGELLAQLIACGAVVTRFAEKSSDLEDIFMQVTKGIVQ